jgi:hypothetical protein
LKSLRVTETQRDPSDHRQFKRLAGRQLFVWRVRRKTNRKASSWSYWIAKLAPAVKVGFAFSVTRAIPFSKRRPISPALRPPKSDPVNL